MGSKIFYWISYLLSRIWLRIAAFSMFSIGAALSAKTLGPLLPSELVFNLGVDSVEVILNILASSMLAVSTFSLGIMASAVAGAAQGTSPRATQLLLNDKTSQNVIATFLGTFVFSLVGIVALKMGVYEQGARLILIGTTIIILCIVFISFVTWVEVLRSFGQVTDTLERVEQTTTQALNNRVASPALGCNILDPESETTRWQHAVYADDLKYVQHIDLAELNRLAEEGDLKIAITGEPGLFATRHKPLLCANRSVDSKQRQCLVNAFTFGPLRDFNQDPRFGFIVLAEIATRALPPGSNDAGTAVDVLRRAERIFDNWSIGPGEPVKFDRIWLPALRADDLFREVFQPIGRDGATIIEVQVVLHETLLGLAISHPERFLPAATMQSELALKRCEDSAMLPEELELVRSLNASIHELHKSA